MKRVVSLSSLTSTQLHELSSQEILKSLGSVLDEKYLIVEVKISLQKKEIELNLASKTIDLELIKEEE